MTTATGVELWWVDQWDDRAGEPLGGGHLVQEFDFATTAILSAESFRTTEGLRHRGKGQLVILDRAGEKLAGPFPVMPFEAICDAFVLPRMA